MVVLFLTFAVLIGLLQLPMTNLFASGVETKPAGEGPIYTYDGLVIDPECNVAVIEIASSSYYYDPQNADDTICIYPPDFGTPVGGMNGLIGFRPVRISDGALIPGNCAVHSTGTVYCIPSNSELTAGDLEALEDKLPR